MTPARDAKHFGSLGEKHLGGSISDEASGKRHLGGEGIWGGIWEKASTLGFPPQSR